MSSCRTAAQKETEALLESTKLDEIEFRQASITEAVGTIVDFSRQLPPERSVLEIKAENPNIMFLDESPDVNRLPNTVLQGGPEPEISFTMHNVSLKDVLLLVCEMAELEYHVDRKGEIVIERSRSKEELLE